METLRVVLGPIQVEVTDMGAENREKSSAKEVEDDDSVKDCELTV